MTGDNATPGHVDVDGAALPVVRWACECRTWPLIAPGLFSVGVCGWCGTKPEPPTSNEA